jgi:prevent-host-death family protein
VRRTMPQTIGIRELRQNASRYLAAVKRGEVVVVTERGREIARIVPSGGLAARYADVVDKFGATVPTETFDTLPPFTGSSAPDGTTDAFLAESRKDRA